MSNEFQNFLHQWGVRHRRSSANYPQSNGRAELGVKAAKRLIIDNTKSDGSLDNNKAAQAIMQYRNTPLPYINLSPAQILFHRQLRDHIPANPVHYKLHKDWIISADQREKALDQRNENIAKKYSVSTRQLPEVPIGTTVAIQEPNSKGYRRWVKTGIVVEILLHCQYHIRLDGSNRITLRNRRFIKPITPNLMKERQIFISPLANPEKVSEPPVSEMPASAQPTVTAEPKNHQPPTPTTSTPPLQPHQAPQQSKIPRPVRRHHQYQTQPNKLYLHYLHNLSKHPNKARCQGHSKGLQVLINQD